MDPFTDLMALFWTLAEGLLLLAMQRGVRALQGRRRRSGPAVLLFIGLSAASLLFLQAPSMAARWGGPRMEDLCAWGAWGLMCAVWVALEGAICVYVVKAYALLAKRPVRARRGLVACAFAAWACLFLSYHWQAGQVAWRRSLDPDAVEALAAFWVRVCGVFWIAIEWAVAVYGWKACRLLARGA